MINISITVLKYIKANNKCTKAAKYMLKGTVKAYHHLISCAFIKKKLILYALFD